MLLQVLFHARIGQERAEAPWSIDDVAAGIVDKLVARHPHVFADGAADTAEQVEASWHALKAAEKGRESATDGIPLALPALVLASKVLARAARAGVSVPLPAIDQPRRDVARHRGRAGRPAAGPRGRSRENGLDAEAALRAAVRRHRAAIRAGEGLPT